MRLNDGSIEDQKVDVDGTRGESRRSARTPYRKLDIPSEAFELCRIEIRTQRRRNIQIRGSFGTVRRGGFIERRDRENLRPGAQALQRGENIALPIAEIRSDPDVDFVHETLFEPPRARPVRPDGIGDYGSVKYRTMRSDAIYPYLLDPKLTTQVWGGDELVKIYGKHGDPNARLGESWECWDADRVINGSLSGSTVADLRAKLGAEFLGDLDPKQIFPVLTKIITAHDWLSVQVHPDDSYAQRVEHQPFGKTECWYVLDAQPNAQIVYGWTRDTSRAEYAQRVADGTLGELLRKISVKTGDSVYIPHGLVHAIGPGVTIFETQQASDLTYRMFDYNRVGLDGKPRELHVQKAADVLNYTASNTGTLEQISYDFEGLDRTALIADDHFVVERIIAGGEPATMATNGRPLIMMTLDARMEVVSDDSTVILTTYQTSLVAAESQWCTVRAVDGDSAPFMFVTPPESDRLLTARLLAAGVAQERIDRFVEQF